MNSPEYSIFSAFVLPRDAEYMNGLYWSPAKAAAAWGCSRATAYRVIERHGEELGRTMIWVVMRGKTELRMVIRANSKRPAAPQKGNPAFRDRQYQSKTARAREAKRKEKRR